MATPSVDQALRVPGRLAAGCTDFTAAYPHGGTALGLVRDVVAERVEIAGKIIRAAEFGHEVHTILRGGAVWSVTFALRGFDGDGVTASGLPTATTGSDVGVVEPGSDTPGSAYTGQVICFSPNNPDHPAVVLYTALPVFSSVLRLRFADLTEFAPVLTYVGTRDASGRQVAVDKIANITNP